MKVILSYGMGVDSTAIFLRWWTEPLTRPFDDWSDLTVLTAQVGDEWPDTAELVERHVYPRLQAGYIRTVQIARRGHHERDGIEVLEDAHDPVECLINGQYSLSHEYMRTGTLPQYATGCRRCTHKAKGVPLDRWIEANGERRYLHVIGYNAEETKRAKRDEGYTALGDLDRTIIYPLIEWGWGRQKCLDFIKEVTGADWKKSCCTFCPFATEQGVVDRFRENQNAAVWAMYLEYQAQALNPRTTLYKNKTLRSVLEKDGQKVALVELGLFMDRMPWAVYRCRRVYEGRSYRSVEIALEGTAAECWEEVRRSGVRDDSVFERAWRRNKGTDQPWGEELFVALPKMIEEKESPGFAKKWARLLQTDEEEA